MYHDCCESRCAMHQPSRTCDLPEVVKTTFLTDTSDPMTQIFVNSSIKCPCSEWLSEGSHMCRVGQRYLEFT